MAHLPQTANLSIHVVRARFLRCGRVETGAYDPGVLHITYKPALYLLDWTALNDYLDTFQTEPGSAEAAVSTIALDLRTVLAPAVLRVVMELNMDGSGGYTYEVATT